ncbi:MAG: hypothetical protein CBB68_11980 [Rhodospirillaceae bacterium TMED8]|nr:hypothetical protein [Magnetovibrio sp.]OUT49284.1 MAG: hypothetical protein CBB68_11980 [Rhodospirillaceae bacterium TMED8]|tara:strand:- start:4 stop:384 length:381 start_codon:yes stop_codon:yes gene_type:complete
MSDSLIQINQLLQNYFELLYHGNVDLIPICFYDDGRVVNLDGEEMISIDMAGFYARISNRKPPAAIKEDRNDIICMIDQFSPTTALAKVEVTINGDRFYDYLTLIRRAGSWKIISKVFHRSCHQSY